MACDCSYFTFQTSFIFESYDNSEVVFLGKVESVSDEVSVFSIIELFKGTYTDQFIEFDNKGSCQLALKKDEVWLIYLEDMKKIISQICVFLIEIMELFLHLKKHLVLSWEKKKK